jgi:hypothetical protein
MAGEVIQGGEFADEGRGEFHPWRDTMVMTTPKTKYFFPEETVLSTRDGALVATQGPDFKSMIFAPGNWVLAIAPGVEFRVEVGDGDEGTPQV